MSQSRVRAAVIGLGRHGLRHVQALRRIDEVELVAVCDSRPEALALATQEHSAPQGYADWKQLLETEQLDLISVVTNGPSHAEITIAAARKRVRYLMCEKPMATSGKDAREMIRACEESGTRLALAHGRRWVRGYRELRQLIESGRIGKLSHFWFTCGGGLFAGNGTHFMDLARMLSGSDAVSVGGVIDATGSPNPRGRQFQDPGAVALFLFRNGMRLVVDMFEDLGIPPRIEIVGSIGRVLIDEIEGKWQVVARGDEDQLRPVGEYWLPLVPVPFSGEKELDMLQMLTDGLSELISDGPISCTGADGLASLEMALGTHLSSSRGGVQVPLPLAPADQAFDLPLT